MKSARKTARVGNTRIRYAQMGKGRPLLFLQGFGINPDHYKPLFTCLKREYEVIAPDLLRSNRFSDQPTSVAAWADLIARFVDHLGLDEYGVVGHSLGGAVGYTLGTRSASVRWIAGLNPVLPASCGPAGLIGRSLHKGARETIGREGLKAVLFANRVHPSVVFHALRDLKGTARLATNVCRFDYGTLDVKQPAAMVYGERDEFFHLSPLVEREIDKAFASITIERHPGLNHDWPVYRPTFAVSAIRSLEERASSLM